MPTSAYPFAHSPSLISLTSKKPLTRGQTAKRVALKWRAMTSYTSCTWRDSRLTRSDKEGLGLTRLAVLQAAEGAGKGVLPALPQLLRPSLPLDPAVR